LAAPSAPGDAQPPPLACPRCGKPMDAGFMAVQGGARMNWVKKIGFFDAAWWFRGEKIIGITDGMVTSPHLRGWRCTDCRLMLLDYGAGILDVISLTEQPKPA
jgi:hypothetical protein